MQSFLIDHNIPRSVSRFLRDEGHDVVLVREWGAELSDEEILIRAGKEKRIVVTNDQDYVGLAPFYDSVDVILFVFESQKAEVRIVALERALPLPDRPFGLLIMQ
jgi:predicted nuclease of predicted toxin-antitoxin system